MTDTEAPSLRARVGFVNTCRTVKRGYMRCVSS